MAPTTPAIPQDNEPLYTVVPSFLQQEQQMAPHTPAIPEQHHQVGMLSAPSANLIVPDLFWPPDLNESGDGEFSFSYFVYPHLVFPVCNVSAVFSSPG